MQEACYHRSQASVHIIDKGIKDARPALLWQNIEIGNGSRDERTVPLL